VQETSHSGEVRCLILDEAHVARAGDDEEVTDR